MNEHGHSLSDWAPLSGHSALMGPQIGVSSVRGDISHPQPFPFHSMVLVVTVLSCFTMQTQLKHVATEWTFRMITLLKTKWKAVFWSLKMMVMEKVSKYKTLQAARSMGSELWSHVCCVCLSSLGKFSKDRLEPSRNPSVTRFQPSPHSTQLGTGWPTLLTRVTRRAFATQR